MLKHFIYSLGFLTLLVLPLTACSDEEPGTDAAQTTQTDSDEEIVVTVYSDGTTSTGMPFRRINEVSFYLNYIKYEIVDGHLNIVGADDTEIKLSLNGKVKPCSQINIDGASYVVREVAGSSFKDCASLTEIVVPNTVVSIGDSAFYNCNRLYNISLSKILKSIGRVSFYGCSALREIELPDSFETINCCLVNGGLYNSIDKIKLPGIADTYWYTFHSWCSLFFWSTRGVYISDIEDYIYEGGFCYDCYSYHNALFPSLINVADSIYIYIVGYQYRWGSAYAYMRGIPTDVKIYVSDIDLDLSIAYLNDWQFQLSSYNPEIEIYVPNSKLQKYLNDPRFSSLQSSYGFYGYDLATFDPDEMMYDNLYFTYTEI